MGPDGTITPPLSGMDLVKSKQQASQQSGNGSSICSKFRLMSSPLLSHFAPVAPKQRTFQIFWRRKPLVRWAHWWWKPCPFVAVSFTHQLPARVCDAEELSGHGTKFRSLFEVGVLLRGFPVWFWKMQGLLYPGPILRYFELIFAACPL